MNTTETLNKFNVLQDEGNSGDNMEDNVTTPVPIELLCIYLK